MAPPVGNPYFVPHQPGTSVSVRDAGDDGVDVYELPASVDPDDFAPRVVNIVVSRDFWMRLCKVRRQVQHVHPPLTDFFLLMHSSG